MNVRNCRVCGRIYNYMVGPNVCPSCREKLEAKFQEVKEYVRAHRGAGIQEVSEECEVDAGQIRQWLREDRLELTEDSPIFLSCESCGAPIRSGRYCEHCVANMNRGFHDAIKSSRPAPEQKKPLRRDDDNPRMRFL